MSEYSLNVKFQFIRIPLQIAYCQMNLLQMKITKISAQFYTIPSSRIKSTLRKSKSILIRKAKKI